MTRRLISASALASILLVGLPASSAFALDEAERLWLGGERAFADGLYPIARPALERFVVEYPPDTRMSSALLLLGRSRLALGGADPAPEAVRPPRPLPAPPPQQPEGRVLAG